MGRIWQRVVPESKEITFNFLVYVQRRQQWHTHTHSQVYAWRCSCKPTNKRNRHVVHLAYHKCHFSNIFHTEQVFAASVSGEYTAPRRQIVVAFPISLLLSLAEVLINSAPSATARFHGNHWIACDRFILVSQKNKLKNSAIVFVSLGRTEISASGVPFFHHFRLGIRRGETIELLLSLLFFWGLPLSVTNHDERLQNRLDTGNYSFGTKIYTSSELKWDCSMCKFSIGGFGLFKLVRNSGP